MNLFREDRNYAHFLRLYTKYITPVAKTYAYCLLFNHFHLLVRFLDNNELNSKSLSRAFNNLFIAYAKSFNRAYDRTGAVFESPFARKNAEDPDHFWKLVVYIHRNPQEHGLIEDFRDWRYSSYQAIVSESRTGIQRDDVLQWFGGREAFEESHLLGDINLGAAFKIEEPLEAGH